MTVRTYKPEDLKPLIALFKMFFEKHSIFEQDKETIRKYIQAQEDDLYVLDEDGIKAALFLVKTGGTPEGTHTRWKFRHLAYHTEKDGSRLIAFAEDAVKNASVTAKIELTIAENERAFPLIQAEGYEQEGKLKDHYRFGEITYILSKSFSP